MTLLKWFKFVVMSLDWCTSVDGLRTLTGLTSRLSLLPSNISIGVNLKSFAVREQARINTQASWGSNPSFPLCKPLESRWWSIQDPTWQSSLEPIQYTESAEQAKDAPARDEFDPSQPNRLDPLEMTKVIGGYCWLMMLILPFRLFQRAALVMGFVTVFIYLNT